MRKVTFKYSRFLVCFGILLVFSELSLNIQSAHAATSCKPGTKKGKTPISLKSTDAPGCFNIALAASGKKLLTASLPCKTCHASNATLYPTGPVTKMNSNMRAQGYTLSVANIKKAFAAHIDEMAGASLKGSEAKAISHYLQSIK